ncbi:MAG: hypothetical protein GY702_26835 [Desulfobulbaceae bacterium]|nr:hypothetical protein [Desulfobulbaceae bacterium]
MNEPGALDERLRTLVMQSFEGGGERLQDFQIVFCRSAKLILTVICGYRFLPIVTICNFVLMRGDFCGKINK